MKTPCAWAIWLLSLLLAGACSAGGGPDGPGAAQGSTSNTGDTGGTGGTVYTEGTGGLIIFAPTGGKGQVDPNDTRNVPVRTQTCTDPANPATCTCLRLALVGTLDSAATNTDTGPFVTWLNTNSEGTAVATMVSTKPTIDAAWLSQYDILISANINSWSFSPQEKEAIATWVRTQGGGIVSLTGFTSESTEPAATSQLIDWSGMSYTATATAPSGGQETPIIVNGQNLRNCIWWTGSSEGGITTAINFLPQPGQLGKLTFSLSYVGAYIGWGITAPPAATVVATDPMSGANMAVAYEVDGAGRILAFGDEWIVFANQWEPKGDPSNQTQDQYNPCWVPPAGDQPGYFHSVSTLYQTRQFWYNAINWAAPPNECHFVIEDPKVIELPE